MTGRVESVRLVWRAHVRARPGDLVRWRDTPSDAWTYGFYVGRDGRVQAFSDRPGAAASRWMSFRPALAETAVIERIGKEVAA